MGIFDLLNSIGDAMNNKQTEIENKARNNYEQKARNASIEELERVIRGAQANGNYVAEEVAREELNRRGY